MVDASYRPACKRHSHLSYQSSKVLNARLSDLVIVALVAVVVVAPMLENAGFQVFSYVDELATLIVVACGALFASASLGAKDKAGVLCLFFVGVLGMLGNALYGYQGSIFAIVVDMLTCLKMFAVYFAAKCLFANRTELIPLFAALGKCFVLFAVAGFIFHVSGLALMGGDRAWNGIPSYQFLYGHPTELAAYTIGFSAILLIEKKNAPWVVLCAVLLVTTQRSKAIAMAAVIIAFVLYNQTKRSKSRPPLVVILLIVCAVAVLGLGQFEFYYGDDSSARTLLTRCGFEIAGDLFPFGSGFATYGTYMSGAYYSPLYYAYGLSSVWGLMPGQAMFVSDSFWPAAAAQFGVIGLFALVGSIVLMFLSLNSAGEARGIPFAARACMPIYLLIASTSDAAFFNFYGVFFALLMASMASIQEEDEPCKYVGVART